LNSTIPPLAFGGQTSAYIKSPYDMASILKPLIKGLKDYDSLVKPGDFLSQSSVLDINGLTCVATSSTPALYKANSTDTGLIIPMHGEGRVSRGVGSYKYRSGATAVLLSAGDFSVENSNRSVLILKIDEAKLEQTAMGMLGFEANKPILKDAINSRELSLHLGNISFDTTFRHYANLLNQYHKHSELLNKTGIDDGIYSTAAVMLFPQLFVDTFNLVIDNQYERRLLDQTCQYIKANLTSPITLTMLDKVSSMSRRKLHYAFLDRFDCSPMQWVRNERLALAHSMLTHAEPWLTVTAIALSCGFTKMSTFAQFYRARFGELPSETLSKVYGR
jgi:AraC-like DNA-binding protein